MEAVERADEALIALVTELKGQMEENELVYGLGGDPASAVYLPKDPTYFMKERKLELRRLLNFPNEKKSKVLAHVIKAELESCDKSEYTDKSLPLLVNQYFGNRIKSLVVMKHSLMLRWKRYCITQELQQMIQMEYNDRLKTIDEEYKTLLSRTLRLQVINEGYICNSDQGIEECNTDDLMLYLKGLVVHLFSMRYMSQIINIIHWVSFKFRKKKKEGKRADSHSFRSEKSVKLDDKSESSAKSDHSKALSAKPSMQVYITNINSDIFASHGGGLAIDEKNLNMPLHTNNIHYFRHVLENLCKVYCIDMNIKNIKTSADEMELFSHVSRKFKATFMVQEQMRLFKVYDKCDGGSDRWGIDSSQHALLKPASWMSYNPFKPKINPMITKCLNHIRSENCVDEFMNVASTFVMKSNCEDTQNSLRHHALIIQHLPVVHNTWVVSNPNGFTIADIFKTIYNKVDINATTFSSEDNTSGENIIEKDSYKFTETLQLLGLDDCVEAKDDPSSVQGAYLSYLHLRFLKIRDLQRTCLSILNYFRSLERTLVIYAHGFSNAKISKQTRLSSDGFEQEVYSTNLGDHQYLVDNIENFKISDNDFMKVKSVVNHDDFYFHENGRIHVKDRKNYWIMYDIAIKDFEELEEELNLIGSYYITMDKDYRTTSLFNRKRSQSENDVNASFITAYGHREVDRHGVLYDLWNQHAGFMHNKMKLVDIYMEVYNSISKPEDKKRISQIMINLFYQKPRLDISRSYLISSYRLESQILNVECEIIQAVLDNEKERYRNYMLTEYNAHEDGYHLVEKALIHVNNDESVLKPMYFLEFIPSLGMIYQVKMALDFTFKKFRIHSELLPVQTELKKSFDFLNFISNEILENELFSITSFDTDTFSPLFSPSILDNPKNALNLGELFIKNIDGRNTRGEKKTRKIKLLNEFGRLLNLLTVRFRLIDLLYECKYITTIYSLQAINMGYGEFHAYMRLIPFERAKRNETADNQKPLLYVSSIQDDDTIVEKYEPDEFNLAIHEFDTVHLGKFGLTTSANIIELLVGKGLEDLQLTLKIQYIHYSSLAVGILLCDYSRPSIYTFVDFDPMDKSDSIITNTAVQFDNPLSLQSGPRPLSLEKQRIIELARYDFYAESFFSIQMEKTPIRDRMHNKFLKQFNNPSNLPSLELEKAKKDSLVHFIKSFSERVYNTSLKAQIISCYSSIVALLKHVPDIANTFFQFGIDSSINFGLLETRDNYDFDPHVLRDRCTKLISDNGRLLNIWYIPHFTEILYLNRESDDVQYNLMLLDLLHLAQSFRDIIHYIIGIYNLSFDNVHVSNKLKDEINRSNEVPQESNCFNTVHQLHLNQKYPINVHSDYSTSNRFQLEKEFFLLESQIQSLKNPTDMKEIIDVLIARKNYHYYYFDAFVTSILPDTLLASNNMNIYDQLHIGLESAMVLVNNKTNPVHSYQDMNVPLPLLFNEADAKTLFPWRSLLDSEGPFTITCDTWVDIAENIQLCFLAIPDDDRSLIKNQLYTFNLLMEEIISEKGNIENYKSKNFNSSENSPFLLSTKFHKTEKKESTTIIDTVQKSSKTIFSDESHQAQHLSIVTNPVETYTVLIKHLLALKKFDLLKMLYCSKKSNMMKALPSEQYVVNAKLIRREILFPQLRKISEELSLPYFYYFGPSSDNDMIIYPKGVSITYINLKLTKALMEEIEKISISEIQWQIIKKLDKAFKDRNYDGKETASSYYSSLKKTYLKSNISANIIRKIQAPLVDKFITKDECEIKEEKEVTFEEEQEKVKENNEIAIVQESDIELITLKKKHLNSCLQYFGNSILNYSRELFECYAMNSENLLKQQQRLLKEKEDKINDLHEQIQRKEESITVQKQFILVDCVINLIMEINDLRGQMRDKLTLYNEQSLNLKGSIALEYKSIVRNIYALCFEQGTQIKISVENFRNNVTQKINDIRVEAFNEMIKVKLKSGAKYTADDDLMARNISINKNLNKNRQANSHLGMTALRMKSLFNWIYMYTFNINDHEIKEYQDEVKVHERVVPVAGENEEQNMKLLKCERKRLKEILVLSKNDLAGLRATLNSEINKKTSKSKKEEMNAIKMKEGINDKRKQINSMLDLIKITNSKMTTMQNQFEEYLANKETVAIKSHKKVGKLKRLVCKERELKEEAFMKVDDLISQVYEFEAAFAVTRDEPRLKMKQISSIESLSKPRNPTTKPGHPTINFDYAPPQKSNPRLSYNTVLKQHCLPYTPCHYLPFRRNRLSLHNLQVELKHEYEDNSKKLEPDFNFVRSNASSKTEGD